MKLPHYSIVGMRPVKAVATEGGGMAILAYNWETGEFDLAPEYMDQVFFGKDEVEQVSEEVFKRYVEKFRQNRSKGS